MQREHSDRDNVVKWLGLASGLHEAAVDEAKPMLRREQVFVVGDLALLEEEGGLGSVFTILSSALAGCVTRCACARGISLLRWVAQPVG